MTILSGDVPAAATQHKEVNNTMHTNTDVNAKTRGPPARKPRDVPPSTCCHTGGPVASANLRGQTSALKQTRFAEGPAVTG